VLPSAPCTRVHNPNSKSIGSAIFAQLTAECRRTCLGMSFPLIIAPSRTGSGLHLIHASLGPPESVTQTASRSVQPFLLSSRQSVVEHVGACPSPQNCPFPWGTCIHLTRGSLVHQNRRPKRHLDRFSRFCTDDHRVFIYFTMGHPFPPQMPLPMGIWTLCNTGTFIGPSRVLNPNGMSIGSAVFAGLNH